MRVYHFLNAHYGVEAIREQRMKVSRICSLNDPFEYLQFQTENHFAKFLLKTRRTEANKRWGLLCFSRSYANPVQWAHYADAHRGLCLGFDIPNEALFKIEYIEQRGDMDEFRHALKRNEEDFLRYMLSKKYSHWAYEEEYRLLHRFNSKKKSDELLFVDFSAELELKEILFGVRFSGDKRSVRQLLKKLEIGVNLFSVAPSSKDFRMIKSGYE